MSGDSAAPPLRLTAVVVTWNRLAQLQTTLPRLLAEPVDRVVVVDNASTDATAAWLAAQTDLRLTVLRLAENLGGAGGFEAGLRAATETGNGPSADWIVLMDDDARPCPGALATFCRDWGNTDPDKVDNSENPGVIVAAVTIPDGTLCEMNRPSRNPFWHPRLLLRTLLHGNRVGFHLADTDFAPDAPAVPIDVASFVGFFVSRGAVARAGLPEGGLFIYGDDVLYSLRLRRAGIGIRLAPAIRFEHDCGTMGDGFIYRPLWKIYYHCRNGVSIARAAAGPLVFPAALAFYTLLWWRRSRHYPTIDERRLYRRLMWRGLGDGLRGRRGRNDTVHRIAASAKTALAETVPGR